MSNLNSANQDGNAEHGGNVGALLRASRERRGEELRDVARVLRIRYPYLEAIEDGRYGDLPGAAYATGFIRAYAEHLGLDSDEIVRRYKSETPSAARPTRLEIPAPMPETGMPGGALVLIGLLLAVVLYGAWYVSSSEEGLFADAVSPLPESLTTMLDKKVGEDGEQPEKAADEGDEKAPVSEEEVAKDTVVSEPAPEVETTEDAVAETASTDTAAPGEKEETTASEAVAVAEAIETIAEKVPAETEVQDEAVAPTADDKPLADVAEVAAEPAKEVIAAETKVQADEFVGATSTPVVEKAKEIKPTVEAAVEKEAPKPEVSDVADAVVAEVAKPSAPAEPNETAADDAKPEQVAAVTPEATPVTTPAEPKAKPAAERNEIVIRATADSWIQIRDSESQTLVLTRLLRKGQTYTVPDRPNLKLVAGNAGALEILVDGKPSPAIGSEGAVRRSVLLEAKRLRDGTAVIR